MAYPVLLDLAAPIVLLLRVKEEEKNVTQLIYLYRGCVFYMPKMNFQLRIRRKIGKTLNIKLLKLVQ